MLVYEEEGDSTSKQHISTSMYIVGWLVRYVLEMRLSHGRRRVVAPVVVHLRLPENSLVDHHSHFVVFLQLLRGFQCLLRHACMNNHTLANW